MVKVTQSKRQIVCSLQLVLMLFKQNVLCKHCWTAHWTAHLMRHKNRQYKVQPSSQFVGFPVTQYLLYVWFLTHDEAMVPRAIIVIVSGSSAWKHFWSQLDGSKEEIDPVCWWGLIGMDGLPNGTIPKPIAPLNLPNQGSESPPFKFQPSRWRCATMKAEA